MVESDDFNAEYIWQNEDSNELDEFDDSLYRFQDEDDEIGKITAASYKFMKTLANLIKIPGSNFDDSDDSNAEDILENEYADKSDEFDNGLYEVQDEDEEIGIIKAPTYQVIKSFPNQIKIPGSNFDDSDDSNAEGIWQNEYSDQLDEFDDELNGFQDEDEEQGKIKALY